MKKIPGPARRRYERSVFNTIVLYRDFHHDPLPGSPFTSSFIGSVPGLFGSFYHCAVAMPDDGGVEWREVCVLP